MKKFVELENSQIWILEPSKRRKEEILKFIQLEVTSHTHKHIEKKLSSLN